MNRELIQQVVDTLTDDLRDDTWRGLPNRLAGHCYVACEAIFHLSDKKMRPHFIRHEGAPHWYLVDEDETIIDPTVEQFDTLPDYSQGRGKGFLTKEPSRRARILMERVTHGRT